jgi:hypothetical protein
MTSQHRKIGQVNLLIAVKVGTVARRQVDFVRYQPKTPSKQHKVHKIDGRVVVQVETRSGAVGVVTVGVGIVDESVAIVVQRVEAL